MSHKNKENEQWKLLVSNLQEKAIEKFGNGWQTELAKTTVMLIVFSPHSKRSVTDNPKNRK